MVIKKSDYEALLAEYSNSQATIALLKQHRPYLEMLPSMRRPEDSLIVIPLPIISLRKHGNESGKTVNLPCDLGIFMCDPEWKVKTGAEIFIFIYRPQEDFSDLLSRWRQTQILLDKEYEWVMPQGYKHIYSQEAEEIYPLFVLFSETPERIKRGLIGASLPFVVQPTFDSIEMEVEESNIEIQTMLSQMDDGINDG
ncbi:MULTISPECIES: hypothetical protein [Okeania]|uniref:Uncharacterized protein n=1 Tax=Okeania hirsuta TaxID=1458930 RepID=A0A3N6R6F2_9CYAN|nr:MULTISPECIES: hypothetical protein [Okeania]NES76859.1 hypothetical protein [Okeania sp. SIO1H4]NES93640.1 hypothetical protein [Okeania sp. SIO2B9]NET20488.1 hypothetical protein [Okeania sp. SIO1H5]NET78261.1 hypothetical protein [Okeania sp. SIO1F9]NET95554.1 hypothetical protein [Okeania sp. SIO1H2]